MGNYQKRLCPVDPFLNIFLKSELQPNVWLMEDCPSEDGCGMKVRLSQGCGLREVKRGTNRCILLVVRVFRHDILTADFFNSIIITLAGFHRDGKERIYDAS